MTKQIEEWTAIIEKIEELMEGYPYVDMVDVDIANDLLSKLEKAIPIESTNPKIKKLVSRMIELREDITDYIEENENEDDEDDDEDD